MKKYGEFITEGKKGSRKEISGRVMTPNSNSTISINYSDDSIEGLRRKLLEYYFNKNKDKDSRDVINKCISTYVYALDKKLRISSDIIDMLAKEDNESSKETQKTLLKLTKEFFEGMENHYGTTA